MRKKIIVIGMLDSIHTLRWLQQFQESDYEFILFPSSPHRRVHPGIRALLRTSTSARFRTVSGYKLLGIWAWLVDRVLGNSLRGAILRRLIRTENPDILHALEFQGAGYIALKALGGSGLESAKFVVTNWGSDIYWFQRFPRHLKKIKAVLALADQYSCECQRDVKLALDHGFKGEVMEVIPNSGGFSTKSLELPLSPASARTVIMVKGYQGWAGQAKVALGALASMSAEIREFEIVVYSCNASTKAFVLWLKWRFGLRINHYGKGQLNHEEMLSLFGKALIYVGISKTDGISTSMLEAMAMGAVPVQSGTSCCQEWISDETGFVAHSLETDHVARGIKHAIELALTTDAAEQNRQTIRARADYQKLQLRNLSFYQ